MFESLWCSRDEQTISSCGKMETPMRKMTKKLTAVFSEAFKKWYSRDPLKESSVIAYNAIFSMPGLLVLVITFAGYFFGAELISQHLYSTISQAIGKDTADMVQQMSMMAMNHKRSILASIFGIATVLIGATGVFVHLQKSLNIIWEVKVTTTKSGIWTFIKKRLFSFGLILFIAFLLLISLVISAFIAAIGNWAEGHWSDYVIWLFRALDFVASLFLVTLLFALMYKILPDAKIEWKTVWIGAFVTALLFVIGKTLLGLYFGKAEPGSGYGAAVSVVLILIWTTYSSAIVFYGAEFTKAYADTYQEKAPATEIAVKEPGKKV
jgi:membrane protein